MMSFFYYLQEPEEEVWNDEDIPDYFEQLNKDKSEQSDKDAGSSISFLSSALLKWQTIYSVSDRCILSLFKIIKTLLSTLNVVIRSDLLSEIIEGIPMTLYSARKIIDLDRDDFEQFMTCPDCYSVYPKDASIIHRNGKNAHIQPLVGHNFDSQHLFLNWQDKRKRDKFKNNLIW